MTLKPVLVSRCEVSDEHGTISSSTIYSAPIPSVTFTLGSDIIVITDSRLSRDQQEREAIRLLAGHREEPNA